MSKVPEDKGGVTQPQTQECSCGYAQWAASLERHPTASSSRRIPVENHKGGDVHIRANSALAAAFRDPAAASPSLQGTRSFKDSGDVKPPSVNPSGSFQGKRSLKNSRRCGDVQLPKSPSGSVSPPSQGECSIRDSRGREDVQQQLAKFPSSNGAHESVQRGRSFSDNGRIGDFQQAQSPSGTASPALKGERGLTDSRRSGDVPQPVSPRTGASPSYQGERSFRDSRGSGDVQQAKSPSVIASPYCQGECILRESKRSADVRQQPKFVSANPSPSSQRERSLRDSRIGDAQQEPKSPSVNASPALGRARSLKDSIRNGDEQQSKSPSVGSSSRPTPVAASPPIQRWGSLEENVKSGGFQGNAASLTSPSGATRAASSSSCTSLKSKLAAGQKLYGALLVSFSTVVAEILGWAGYDFVVLDLDQLFPGDTFAALPVLQALESTGTPAIFRLPGGDPVLVSKALDMGPAGLMFSMIENEEAARNAVASCRYPPRGMRRASRHMVSRASRYGLDVSYMDHCEEDLFVMCQVETMEALEKVMEIAGVDGVDCIHMGGLEFGASLGDPYLDFNKERVLSRQRKVFLAGLATSENSPESLFKRGYHLVSGAVDVVLLRDAALADLRRNKPSQYLKSSA